MVDPKLRKKILKLYYSLRYPGSFQGVNVFRKSLIENSDIHVTEKDLRRILKSSLPYQVNKVKPKKFKTRSQVSKGVGIEAYCDPVFFPYQSMDGDKKVYKNFHALFVCDIHSRYLWTYPLKSINPHYLKVAFSTLFRNGMPKFSLIRCDLDKSLNTLTNTFFAKNDILLMQRRSLKHMAFLEGVIRNCKRRFVKNLRMAPADQEWTQKKLEAALRDVTFSYNNTESSSHGMKPAECNFPEFDPVLRKKLYGDQKLERFETLYTQILERNQEANTPREESEDNFKEGPNDFKKDDIVYIDFKERNVGSRAYAVRRGPLYRVSRVNVLADPYLYKLSSLTNEREQAGWYYGRELTKGNLSDLEVEHVVKVREKKTPSGKKLIKVKYKDHDDSFNRWIERS